MRLRAPLTISPLRFSTGLGVRLAVVLCLMALIVGQAAACNVQRASAIPCLPPPDADAGWLSTMVARGADAFITAEAAPSAAGDDLLFTSPAETETPDFEPAILRVRKISVVDIVRPSSTAGTPIIIRGTSVPLYLTHQSLLC